MKQSMANIFVKVNFSEKCLFMGAIFNFWRQDRSGISWWWITWGPWSGPYTGTVPLEVQRGYLGLYSVKYTVATGLYLIGLVNFYWLEKAFDSHWGQVLGRTLYMNISSTHSRTVRLILFLVPVKPDEGPGAANSLNTSDDIGLKPLLNVLLCTDSALHTSECFTSMISRLCYWTFLVMWASITKKCTYQADRSYKSVKIMTTSSDP